MAKKTYISPLGGIAIAEDNGKTYISPIRGIAVQDEAAAVGATRRYSLPLTGVGSFLIGLLTFFREVDIRL